MLNGLREEIDLLKKRDSFLKLQQAREAIATGAGVQDERRFRNPATAKVAAPVVDKGAGDRAQALLKQQLANRLKDLESALNAERDAFAFHQRYLDQVYDAGQLSAQQFYDARNTAAQRALQAQLNILDQEAAAIRGSIAKFTDPKERAAKEGELSAVLERQGALRLKGAQDAVLAAGTEARALEQLQGRYKDLEATLLQLQGNEFGATAIRNAQQVAQAQQLIKQAGQDPGVADRLAVALEQQNRFAQIKERVSDVARQAAISEEKLRLRRRARRRVARRDRARHPGRAQPVAAAARGAAREDRRHRCRIQQPRNPEVRGGTRPHRQARQRRTDPALKRLQEASKNLGQGIAGTFEDAIVNGGKFGDILKDIEKQIRARSRICSSRSRWPHRCRT